MDTCGEVSPSVPMVFAEGDSYTIGSTIGTALYENMFSNASSSFPQYVDELQGMADAIGITLEEMVLWNLLFDWELLLSDETPVGIFTAVPHSIMRSVLLTGWPEPRTSLCPRAAKTSLVFKATLQICFRNGVPPDTSATLCTAAEPSKQSEVLIDACEYPVDKGNVIMDTLRNFRSLYKCCQVANAPYERFICSICSKTQIIPVLNNDLRTVKSHCSDFLPF
eukprot:Em0005g965a